MRGTTSWLFWWCNCWVLDRCAGGTRLLIGICYLCLDRVADWIMWLGGPNCWIDLMIKTCYLSELCYWFEFIPDEWNVLLTYITDCTVLLIYVADCTVTDWYTLLTVLCYWYMLLTVLCYWLIYVTDCTVLLTDICYWLYCVTVICYWRICYWLYCVTDWYMLLTTVLLTDIYYWL